MRQATTIQKNIVPAYREIRECGLIAGLFGWRFLNSVLESWDINPVAQQVFEESRENQ